MNDATQKPAVLSVGRLYCDLIFTDLPRMPTLGTEVFADGFGAHAGGGAFITAAHLSQLGHPAALAAMLPVSPFGDLMRGDLETSGVDLSLCAPLSATKGPQVTVAMAQNSDRSFLTRRAGPAFPMFEAEELAKRRIRHLHVGELASLIAQPDVVRVARAQGATISSDCGWDDDLDFEALRPLVGSIDVFLPNEAEMKALQNLGLTDPIASVTVVKRGPLGATALSADGALAAPGIPANVIDTTGAGDAFNAGFLSNWLGGAPLLNCLEAGNRRGAIAVSTRGGFSSETTGVSEMHVVGE